MSTTGPLILFSIPEDQMEALVERCMNRVVESIEKKSSEDEPLSAEKAAAFLNLALPTLYTKVHLKQIPYHKQGKKLTFFRSELIFWLKSSNQIIKS